MATPARSRHRPHTAPGETVVLDEAVKQIRFGSRFTWARLRTFVRRVVCDEPTLLGEISGWGFVASWSVSLLLYRTSPLPDAIAAQFERGPYFAMAILGAILAAVQLAVMVSQQERPRAVCAFFTSVWLGGLAMSLFGGDARVPSGFGYLILSSLSMLAFWRVHPRLAISLVSGAVSLLRRGNNRTRH